MPGVIQTIQLQGAAEFLAQMQQIGQAGAAAFATLGAAAAQVSGNVEKAGGAIEKAGARSKESGASLIDLGQKGREAFAGLSEASERFAGSLSALSAGGAIGAFQGLTGVIEEVSGAFGGVGKAVALAVGGFGAAVAGTAGLAVGLGELAKSSSESIVALDNLAKEAGTTVQDIVGLQGAFAASGVAAETFNVAMRAIAVRLTTDWPTIAKAVRDASEQIERDQIKIRDATIAASGADDLRKSTVIATQEALINASRAERNEAEAALAVKEAALRKDQARNAVADARLSREAAAHSVAEAEYNLQVALTGQRDKDVERQLRIEGAEQALAQAKQHQLDISHQVEQAQLAERKAALDYANALDQQKRAALEAQKAQIDLHNAQRQQDEAGERARLLQLDLAAARKKADDDQLKNIPAIADTLGRAATGQADAQKDVNLHLVETADLYKAIELNASKREGGLTGKNVVLELAAAYQALGNTLESNNAKLALARQLGVRGVGQEFVNALNQGPAKIEEQITAKKGVGFDLANQVEGAHKFEEALAELQGTLGNVKDLTGATLFDTFSLGMKKLEGSLSENRQGIVDWAKSFEGIKAVIADVFNVFSGEKPATGFIQSLVAVKDAIVSIGQVANTVANSPLFKALFGDIDKTFGGSQDPNAPTPTGILKGGLALLGNRGPLPEGPAIDPATGKAPEDYAASVRAEQLAARNQAPLADAANDTSKAASDTTKAAGSLQDAAKALTNSAALLKPGETKDEKGVITTPSGFQYKVHGGSPTAEGIPVAEPNVYRGGHSQAQTEQRAENARQQSRSAAPIGAPGSFDLGQYTVTGAGSTRIATGPGVGDADTIARLKAGIIEATKAGQTELVAAMRNALERETRAQQAGQTRSTTRRGIDIDAPTALRDMQEHLADTGLYLAPGGSKTVVSPSYRQELKAQAPADTGAGAGAGAALGEAFGKLGGVSDNLTSIFAQLGAAASGLADLIRSAAGGQKAQAPAQGGSGSSGGGDSAAPAPSGTEQEQYSTGGTFAAGGLISGPGSATSDSIPAMLSHGEYVVRADGGNLAAAIAHFGARLRSFSLGGLVDGLMAPLSPPGFAEGGLVTARSSGGGSAPHHVLDLRTDAGNFRVTAERSVVDAMSRSAINSRLTQAGTKPDWYR